MALLIVVDLVFGIAYSFTYADAGYFLYSLIESVPFILICVGLSLYAYSCRKDGDNINTFSLKLLRIATIIYLISYLLGRIVYLSENYDYLENFTNVLILATYIVLLFIYCIKCYKALKGIEMMIKTGIPEVCISFFIIFMNFLMIFLKILGFIYILAYVFELVFLVLFSIVLFMLRKDLQNLVFKISINPDLAKVCEKPDDNLSNAL